jgi:hypothetical protein
MARNKTAIVRGAQQGTGAGLVDGFLLDSVLYLTHARQVTGEGAHVDAGVHGGHW